MSLVPIYVEPSETTVEDLAVFGIKVREIRRDPQFQFSLGNLWKSAGSLWLYDDGRISVTVHHHLTERERTIMYGQAATLFRDGVSHCRANEFTRLRKSKKRPVGGWWQFLWLGVRRDDPLYERIHWAAYGHHPEHIQSLDAKDERLHQQQAPESVD